MRSPLNAGLTEPAECRLDRAPGRLLFGDVTQIHDLTVTEHAAAIRDGELSPVEITDHYLDRIDRLDEQVGAFYTVTHDLARQEAGHGREGRRARAAEPGQALRRCPR